MKKLIYFSIFYFTLVSCQKDEVKVPLANQIEGRYTMQTFSNGTNSFTLPYTLDGSTLSARVVVTKITDETVDFNLINTVKSSSITQSSPELMKGVSVTEISENNLNVISDSGQKIATFNGDNIEVFFMISGTPVTYLGTKDL